MTQITRRRLFGLMAGLVAIAAVPVEKVAAAPAPEFAALPPLPPLKVSPATSHGLHFIGFDDVTYAEVSEWARRRAEHFDAPAAVSPPVANYMVESTSNGTSQWRRVLPPGSPASAAMIWPEITPAAADAMAAHAQSAYETVPVGFIAVWTSGDDPPAGWARVSEHDGRFIVKTGATGGPIDTGQPLYLVGEHGGETVIPTRVTHNIRKSGELHVTITANASQVDEAVIRGRNLAIRRARGA